MTEHAEHIEYTEPNEAACARVIELGKEGFRIIEIASQMNVTADTLMGWYAEDDEFADAVALSEVHAAAKAQEWIRTAMERGFGITETHNAVKAMFRHLHPTPLTGAQELRRQQRAAEFFEAKAEAEREEQEALDAVEAARVKREKDERDTLVRHGWHTGVRSSHKKPPVITVFAPPDHYREIPNDGMAVLLSHAEPDYIAGGRWLYDDDEGKFLWNEPTDETRAEHEEDEKREKERSRANDKDKDKDADKGSISQLSYSGNAKPRNGIGGGDATYTARVKSAVNTL